MKRAVFVKKVGPSEADQRLYRVSPPMQWTKCYECDTKVDAEYVVVSASNVPFSGPETYIFAADEDGKIVRWTELDGSFRGELDHEKALRGAGYEVVSS